MNKTEIKRNYSQPNNNKTNYLPWILGGVGLLGLIGIVVYFLRKEKNNG